MSNEKNSTTEPEQHYDDLPAAQDDAPIAEQVADLQPEVPAVVAEQEQETVKPSPRGDQKRDDIARMFKENRQREIEEEKAEADGQPRNDKGQFTSETDPAEEIEATSEDEVVQPDEEESTQNSEDTTEEFVEDHGKQYSKPATDETIQLVVDGEVVEMPLSEVRKNAQINLAADNRLEHAKNIYANVKEREAQLNQIEQQNDQKAAEPEPAPEPEPYQPDRNELASIVEAIQIGDAEEGTVAVEKLVGMMMDAQRANQPAVQESQPGLTPEQVDQQIRETLTFQNQQDTATKAYYSWANGNSDIVQSSEASEFMRATTLRNMREDLLSIGVTKDELQPISNNVDALAAAHGYHNMNGRLRSYDDLLKASEEHVRNVYRPLGAKPVVKPTQKTSTQKAREAQKRSLQQPKHGTQRTSAPKKQAPPTAADYIQELRQKRGYR